MSEIEIKQMQEKINAGILLARKRLIEKKRGRRIGGCARWKGRTHQSQRP